MGIGFVADRILDFLYPPACVSCMAPIAQTGSLCASCWKQVRWIEPPYCYKLGIPFEQDMDPDMLSVQALAYPPPFERARAVAVFEPGPVRHMIHRLKYGDRLELVSTMSRWMARAGAELLREAEVMAPVPMHVFRLWRRHFNQAALLSQEIARISGVVWRPQLLQRRKNTPHQVGLSRSQRTLNLQGAFQVSKNEMPFVEGRRILIVDDVLTSGATASAIAHALLKAGATSVDILVFAQVLKS